MADETQATAEKEARRQARRDEKLRLNAAGRHEEAAAINSDSDDDASNNRANTSQNVQGNQVTDNGGGQGSSVSTGGQTGVTAEQTAQGNTNPPHTPVPLATSRMVFMDVDTDTFAGVVTHSGNIYRVKILKTNDTHVGVRVLTSAEELVIPRTSIIPDPCPNNNSAQPVNFSQGSGVQPPPTGPAVSQPPPGPSVSQPPAGPSVSQPPAGSSATSGNPANPSTQGGGGAVSPPPPNLSQMYNTVSAMVTQALQAQAGSSNNNAMLAKLTELAAQGQQGIATNAAAVTSILTVLQSAKDESDKASNKAVDIETHETEIPEILDDMSQSLSLARFLPIGTDYKYWQGQIPKTSAPLRTNYELGEMGIVYTQHRAIHAAHDRAAPTLTLKQFRPENLSKTEEKKSFTFNKHSITQKPDEVDIENANTALRALLNYYAIRSAICPADREPLTLVMAVFNTYFDQVTRLLVIFPPQTFMLIFHLFARL